MIAYQEFYSSKQGFNHLKVNKVCQDYSGSLVRDDVAIIAVADGHGSDNYPRTDRGSKFAISESLNAVAEFVETVKNNGIDLSDRTEEKLEQLAKNILGKWHVRVESDVACEPLTEEEIAKVSERYKVRYLSGRYNAKAYGTTLILVCITEAYWFGMHIGDGKCVAVSAQGEIFEPIPWDDDCQQNVTTSICDSDAIDEFRYYYSTELPIAVFAGSDGIDDSFPGAEELYELYRNVLMIAAEHGIEAVRQEMDEYLPSLSRRGSGDDVTMAGLVCTENSRAVIAQIKAQGDYERAKREYDQLTHEADVLKERSEYIEEAIRKNYAERDMLITRREKAKSDAAALQAKLSAAENRLHTAKESLKAVFDPIAPAEEEVVEKESSAVVQAEEIAAEALASPEDSVETVPEKGDPVVLIDDNFRQENQPAAEVRDMASDDSDGPSTLTEANPEK